MSKSTMGTRQGSGAMGEQAEESKTTKTSAFMMSSTGEGSDEEDVDILKIKQMDLIVSNSSFLYAFLILIILQHEPESYQRKWLTSRGKSHMIDF